MSGPDDLDVLANQAINHLPTDIIAHAIARRAFNTLHPHDNWHKLQSSYQNFFIQAARDALNDQENP